MTEFRPLRGGGRGRDSRGIRGAQLYVIEIEHLTGKQIKEK